MAANATREPSLQFDLYEIDINGGQLRRSGFPVDLPPQALRILALLATRPDELVTRNEIKQALWPDESYGDFDGRLNFAVKRLREALGDNAERPRYIRTERKAGYRFIAPVRPTQEGSSVADDALPVRSSPAVSSGGYVASGRYSFSRGALLAALVTLASVAAIGSLVLRTRTADPPASSGSAAQLLPASTDDSKPEIYSVTPIIPQARQRIVIQGRGFGLHVPYAHSDSPYLAVRDDTAHWAAGRLVPHNWDEVMLDVESWADNEIVISGFSGDYGLKGWKLSEGDELEVAVWNPQNGAGPARYRLAVILQKARK